MPSRSMLCALVVLTLVFQSLARAQYSSRAPSTGSTWFVDGSASGSNSGKRWADAFTDLQSALAVAGAGQEIWVAAGTYVPSTNDATISFSIPSGVRLYGGFAGTETRREQRDVSANPTILSGDIGADDVVGTGHTYWYTTWNINTPNSGHVLDASGTSADTVVDGFTIANGATGPSGTPSSSPLMIGSGLYMVGGAAQILNCTFVHNLAGFGPGGAVYLLDASPTLAACTFLENYVHLSHGGGVYVGGTSAPTIEDCSFVRNVSRSGTGGTLGAGLAHYGSQPLSLRGCTFVENVGRPFYPVGSDFVYGGGVGVLTADLAVIDCTFLRNEACVGAGISTFGGLEVTNVLMAQNKAIPRPNDPFPEIGGDGAGIAGFSFAPKVLFVRDSTFTANTGKKYVALSTYNGTSAVIENSILWGDVASHPEVVGNWKTELGGPFELAHCCVRYIFDPPGPGEDPIDPGDLPGCIDDDPLLVAHHLGAGSPCIDAGDNSLLPTWLAWDLDGFPRRIDDPAAPDVGNGTAPLVDMGAFEKH